MDNKMVPELFWKEQSCGSLLTSHKEGYLVRQSLCRSCGMLAALMALMTLVTGALTQVQPMLVPWFCKRKHQISNRIFWSLGRDQNIKIKKVVKTSKLKFNKIIIRYLSQMYDWIHKGNRKVEQGMVSLVVDNFDKKHCSLIQRKWRQLYISRTERSTLSIIKEQIDGIMNKKVMWALLFVKQRERKMDIAVAIDFQKSAI